jgi:hypothetical protein
MIGPGHAERIWLPLFEREKRRPEIAANRKTILIGSGSGPDPHHMRVALSAQREAGKVKSPSGDG